MIYSGVSKFCLDGPTLPNRRRRLARARYWRRRREFPTTDPRVTIVESDGQGGSEELGMVLCIVPPPKASKMQEVAVVSGEICLLCSLSYCTLRRSLIS